MKIHALNELGIMNAEPHNIQKFARLSKQNENCSGNGNPFVIIAPDNVKARSTKRCFISKLK